MRFFKSFKKEAHLLLIPAGLMLSWAVVTNSRKKKIKLLALDVLHCYATAGVLFQKLDRDRTCFTQSVPVKGSGWSGGALRLTREQSSVTLPLLASGHFTRVIYK